MDIQGPSAAELAVLREEFGFHELALEDVSRRHQRPKVDEYGDHYFVVFYAVEGQSGAPLALHEVDLFLGRNYLVSVHRDPISALDEAYERWRRNPDRVLFGVARLLYSVLDSIVDGYFPVLDGVAEQADELEEQVFARPDWGTLQAVFKLKKDLLALRRVLGPERDVLNHFLRHDQPLFGPAVIPYLQDVYDHLLRLTDSVDLYRDLLASTLEVHLAATSNTLNVVVKRLTAVTVLLMAPTLVAGIYGMNFHLTPSPEWPPSFAVVVGIMLVISLVLAVLFRRGNWL